MSDQSKIIETELPLHFKQALDNYELRDDGHEMNGRELRELARLVANAQREAVHRFVEAVAKQTLRFMESGTFNAMGQFTPEFAQAAAFQMIRDTLALAHEQ